MRSHPLGLLALFMLASCEQVTERDLAGEEAPSRSELVTQSVEFEDGFGGVSEVRSVGREADGRPLTLPLEALQSVVTEIPAAEIAARVAQRERDGVQMADRRTANQRVTDDVLARAAERPPEELTSVVVVLEEVPFDFTRFARLKEALEPERARDDLVAERTAGLAAFQQAFMNVARGLGAVDLAPFWLANNVSLRISAGQVAALARVPGVVAVTDVREGTSSGLGGYNALENSTAMRVINFKNWSYFGQTGNRVDNTAIRYALIDFDSPNNTNCLMWAHDAFRDWVGGPTRVVVRKLCDANSCVNDGCGANGNNHASEAAAFMLADGGTPERQWMAPEGELYYYRNLGGPNASAAVARGIETAVADGADVLSMPIAFAGGECNPNMNPSGMNGVMKNALAAGLVMLSAAGNDGGADPNVCTVEYPGSRSEVLSVGGLEPGCVLIGTHPPYNTFPIVAGSARGGANIIIDGWTAVRELKMVDGVAPDDMNEIPTIIPNGWNEGDPIGICAWGGTSYAMSVVAGALGLVRQVYDTIGWNTAGIVTTDSLLMTDGWESDSNTFPSWGGGRRSGFGRAKFHYPGDADFVEPWGWTGEIITLSGGQSACRAVGNIGIEPAGVNLVTTTAMWFEEDFTNAGDVTLQVRSNCPSACVSQNPQIIHTDGGYDIAKRVRLWSPAQEIQGKCLEVVLQAYHIPAGQTRRVYWAVQWNGSQNNF